MREFEYDKSAGECKTEIRSSTYEKKQTVN